MKIHIRLDKIKDLVVGNGCVAGKTLERSGTENEVRYKDGETRMRREPSSVEGRSTERGSVAYKSIDHSKFHRAKEIRFDEFNT